MAVSRSTWQVGEVVENRAWTERLFSLRIAVHQQPFKAGQFVRLQLEVDGELVAKPYSVVNPPDELDMLEVFYSTVPNGKLSNALAKLHAGDRIEVSQPANGFFVLDEIPDKPDLWMMGTGTGLGPYISILQTDELWQRFDRVVLVHGVAKRTELVYSNFIAQFQVDFADKFHYASCVSREENPSGINGRMTEAVVFGRLESMVGFNLTKTDSHVMLCGNHHMIDDMKSLLAQRDMHRHLRHKPGEITTEQYF